MTLPPPLAPPGDGSASADVSTSAGAGPDAERRGGPPGPPRGDDERWDLDRVRGYVEWWLRPLLDPAGWAALGYLAVGAVAAPILFGLTVVAFAVSAGLVLVVVGLFLLAGILLVVDRLARVEAARAGWIGRRFEVRRHAPPERRGFGRAFQVLGDASRWRQVAWVAANLVVAPVLFSLGSAPYTLAMQGLSGFTSWDFWGFDLVSPSRVFGLIVALPFAVFFAGLGPRIVRWVADRHADVTEFFLGPDRLAEATERVESLSTQRQDILDAVAHERRRIERNLHDGVQQQLVAIGLDLGMAIDRLDRDPEASRELLVDARGKVQSSIGQLRQLGRGLHPAILEDRGLDAALSAVVSGAPIPISVHVEPGLELSMNTAEVAYFVANEAVANVLKHARARVASVHVVAVGTDRVRITVHDDGRGGADASLGTGLAGIGARVRALDGTFHVASPDGGPTTITAELPTHG